MARRRIKPGDRMAQRVPALHAQDMGFDPKDAAVLQQIADVIRAREGMFEGALDMSPELNALVAQEYGATSGFGRGPGWVGRANAMREFYGFNEPYVLPRDTAYEQAVASKLAKEQAAESVVANTLTQPPTPVPATQSPKRIQAEAIANTISQAKAKELMASRRSRIQELAPTAVAKEKQKFDERDAEREAERDANLMTEGFDYDAWAANQPVDMYGSRDTYTSPPITLDSSDDMTDMLIAAAGLAALSGAGATGAATRDDEEEK